MKRVWVTDQPGRAASPQAAVRPVSNILHSEGRYARQVEAPCRRKATSYGYRDNLTVEF